MPSNTLADWQKLAEKTTLPTRAHIDGQAVDALSGETFTSINPANGKSLAEVASCDEADVDRATQAARAAFADGRWSRAPQAERKRVMGRMAEAMRENAEELALLDSLDMGKRVVDALSMDVPFSASLFDFYGEAIDKLNGEVVTTDPGVHATITKEPLGVVGAVVPWNYPVDMAAWKLAPALAAGCSVVLKPAEQSPLSALRLAELFSAAGLPDGVLNVLPGMGATAGRSIGLHQDIDTVVFTGSTQVGKMFQRYAGESNMKQVWPECGGKSPNLIFNDTADLQKAAESAAFDVFFNQGAVCSSHSRVLVQRGVHAEFVGLLRSIAAGYAPGNPLDPAAGMGALVTKEHTDMVQGFIERARPDAELIHGGGRLFLEGSDCYIEPTIFDQVHPDSELARDEVFGPVMAIIPFDTEEEALRIANDTPFGLAASLWTSDISRVHRLSRSLVAGTVTVNATDAFGAQTPFGGFKGSGYGRDLSLHALDKYQGLKTTWISY
ncbi:aldehyde dehydrogenase [Paeniglutamicibacter cryotolerans]|uniref:Gamma-glutamyl-gamma-aminobutyraldehyde dehydrogenase n=1 Tax=Paeniglutamicibacter cryotolerans TaxID=670079 RepID=A0A839QLX1_9MICC|nr:aldehyde dehydrogenase [Paeniglutamicibacter cryotolerans]MBB2995754.1 gamma-glutamyl-gamma-aminobutyraldehyde dehydrogenase [Paeniglutamicibacter cryotolerans]